MKGEMFYINNPESMKEIAEGIFLDVHGNVFVFDKDAYLSSYEDDGVNLRVLKHPNKYTTVIINIEDAYRHLFGGDEKPEITIIRNTPAEHEPEVPETIKVREKPAYMRYNKRLLKEAYLAVVRDKQKMTSVADRLNVDLTVISSMCRKYIHVEFTDELDMEYGLTPYGYASRQHREISYSDMEEIYIAYHILHEPVSSISKAYGVSSGTVSNIVHGSTKKAQGMIEDLMSSGKLDEAKRQDWSYDIIKSAYLAHMRDKKSLQEVSELCGIPISVLTSICCKRTYKSFTDNIDAEYGLMSHAPKKVSILTEETMEDIYIGYYIFQKSISQLADEYGVSDTAVRTVIHGSTQKAQKMIDEITRSGRFVEAKKKFDKKKFEAMNNDTSVEEVSDIA